MAMNSTVLLAEENRQLQAENQRQKKKRAKQRSYIATGGVLTVQEGLKLSQAVQLASEIVSRVANKVATTGQIHVLYKYSIYRSESHTARTCPTRQDS
jgi:hypothetical protein